MSHAVLAPSGSNMWSICTNQARLAATFPETTSIYAEEGSAAHAWAEAMLRLYFFDAAMPKPTFRKETDLEPWTIREQVTEGWYPWNPSNKEMEDHVKDYVNFCIETYAEYTVVSSGPVGSVQNALTPSVYVEQKVSLNPEIPESYGTSDFGIISTEYGILHIIDLKYGQGVPVSAKKNKQLLLYAFGMLKKIGPFADIHTVRVSIHQPRLDSRSTYEISAEELIHWVTNVMAPLAAKAFSGNGIYAAGEHCRFCAAKGSCRELTAHNLRLQEIYKLREAALLSPAEIGSALSRSEILSNWASAIKDYALNQLIAGKDIPGWKLIAGRSNRAYADQEAIKSILSEDFPVEKYEKKSLIPLGELEKLTGKAYIGKKLSLFIIKPEGAPTLAPADSDKQEITRGKDAATAFKEFITV
jgi:hypothetical protein